MTSDHDNIEILKTYLDRQCCICQKLVNEKFIAAEKANDLMRETMNAKFQASNEWREESKMRAQEFMTRAEFTQMHDRVLEDIRSLRESRAEVSGKASQNAFFITFLLALGALFVGVIALLQKFM